METFFGNLISFKGIPIIEDVSRASTDITSPNSSIIEWTASIWPFLIYFKIDDTVITGGLITASKSNVFTKGKKCWLI